MTLSESAIDLLRRCAAGERVDVTAETRPAYRELAAAGIMYPLSTFARGPESLYRFTDEGWERRAAWLNGSAPSIQIASPAISPSPAR